MNQAGILLEEEIEQELFEEDPFNSTFDSIFEDDTCLRGWLKTVKDYDYEGFGAD